MDFFSEIFEYRFLANALLASVLSGIVCGVMGTYIVCRRMVFMSGGITHASFGGIGVAYYMGLNPVFGAMVFAVLSAVGVEFATTRGKMREDSMIGIFWSVGMAIGIIFIYLTPGYAPNLMSFLFGNILTVTSADIRLLGWFAVFVIAIFALMHKVIMYVAFDREYSRSQGVPVKFISYMMAVLVALTIVFSIRVVGIMLLISLLTMPAAIANTFSRSFTRISMLAAIIATLANIAGLYISYQLNVPASATTIFVLAITLIVAKLLPLPFKRSIRKR